MSKREVVNFFRTTVKNLDIFGKNITLTYRGKENYKTAFGSYLSIIFFIVLLSKGLTDFSSIWSGHIESVSTQVVFSDPDEFERDKITINRETIKHQEFGFGFADVLPPEIGEISVVHNQIKNKTRVETTIKTKTCESNGFRSKMNCIDLSETPDDFSISLQGNHFSEVFSYLKVTFISCLDQV